MSPATVAQLKHSLLTINDMPNGWTTFSTGKNVDSRRGFCDKLTRNVGYTRAAIGYDKTTEGPLVAEVLRGYHSTGAALRSLAATRRRASSCNHYIQDGDKATLAPSSFNAVIASRPPTRGCPGRETAPKETS